MDSELDRGQGGAQLATHDNDQGQGLQWRSATVLPILPWSCDEQTRLAGTSPMRKDLVEQASATHAIWLVAGVGEVWLGTAAFRGVW